MVAAGAPPAIIGWHGRNTRPLDLRSTCQLHLIPFACKGLRRKTRLLDLGAHSPVPGPGAHGSPFLPPIPTPFPIPPICKGGIGGRAKVAQGAILARLALLYPKPGHNQGSSGLVGVARGQPMSRGQGAPLPGRMPLYMPPRGDVPGPRAPHRGHARACPPSRGGRPPPDMPCPMTWTRERARKGGF